MMAEIFNLSIEDAGIDGEAVEKDQRDAGAFFGVVEITHYLNCMR